ncbi:MAG: hypothetical protein AB7L65_06115 [Hyphomonadaceae bacterium]
MTRFRDAKFRDEGALKPIGLALTAVVAGLGAAAAGAAPAAEAARVKAFAPDTTLGPAADEDPGLILGPSAPLEPFAEAPEERPAASGFDL